MLKRWGTGSGWGFPSGAADAAPLSTFHEPYQRVSHLPIPLHQLNDGPAPKEDVHHMPKPSWQQAAWPLNDQPPRRRNWPLDDDARSK